MFEILKIQPKPELTVKISRGKKGSYGWEIEYSGDDMYEVLNIIFDVDLKLTKWFIEETRIPAQSE